MSDNAEKTPSPESETASTSTNKKDYAQLIQSQVSEIKQELLQRVEVLKSQFSLSPDDLSSLKDTLKTEVSAILEDVTQVSKNIKQELTELSAKHKDSLTATIQRSKDHTLGFLNRHDPAQQRSYARCLEQDSYRD
jgi:thiamine kinase-like enzyme